MIYNGFYIKKKTLLVFFYLFSLSKCICIYCLQNNVKTPFSSRNMSLNSNNFSPYYSPLIDNNNNNNNNNIDSNDNNNNSISSNLSSAPCSIGDQSNKYNLHVPRNKKITYNNDYISPLGQKLISGKNMNSDKCCFCSCISGLCCCSCLNNTCGNDIYSSYRRSKKKKFFFLGSALFVTGLSIALLIYFLCNNDNSSVIPYEDQHIIPYNDVEEKEIEVEDEIEEKELEKEIIIEEEEEIKEREREIKEREREEEIKEKEREEEIREREREKREKELEEEIKEKEREEEIREREREKREKE